MIKKICIVVSSDMTVKSFLLKHIELLSRSYEIYIVMNSNVDIANLYGVNCKSYYIPIERKISFIKDITSIKKLYNFFKIEKFDLVLSVTPKAGLLAMIASFFVSVKHRVHFFTGQVWVTKIGVFRLILKNIDRGIFLLSTHVLIDSISQRIFLMKEKVVSSNKSSVLLYGSISGVDTKKFIQNNDIRKELRQKYHILEDDIVFIFMGRLNLDKGVLDLYNAFRKLILEHKNIKLFIVGQDEENLEKCIADLVQNNSVFRIDHVLNPEIILNVADILILPSYREGFGTIVIEAASMEIPCIGSDIYGLSDAIQDNVTGLLHKKGNVEDIRLKCEYLIQNRHKIKEFGVNAQQRVDKCFQDIQLSNELKKYIDGL
ncbi:glycosyltransferase [Sulfurospirillum oryzae]|uniref:glycosyltransferase n=1 Tax=Sulfurospirillum oryzae TaxID=2976535 RepID=UPI0021E9897E|nr:glycosyltransferase [Sulfurospirillum oryzae]